MLTTNFQSRSK